MVAVIPITNSTSRQNDSAMVFKSDIFRY